MKCHTTTECQADEHLIINLDLRTEQDLRIRDLAQTILPLREAIGARHVSVTLTYSANQQTEYTNLPVIVTGTPANRVLTVIIPPETVIPIRVGGELHSINELSYQIERTTETITEVYAFSKNALQKSPFNYVEIDLDLMTPEEGVEAPALEQSLTAQFLKFSDYTRPYLFQISRTCESKKVTCYSYCYAANIQSSKSSFSINVDIPEKAITTAIRGARLVISSNYSTKDGRITYVKSHQSIPGNEVIFLYENSDGVIVTTDLDGNNYATVPSSSWDNLYNALLEKRFPALYLRSRDSELYCPVNYHFIPNADDPTKFNGTMRISYLKANNGSYELWIENRNFILSFFSGILSGYDVIHPDSGPRIIKLPLGTPLP